MNLDCDVCTWLSFLHTAFFWCYTAEDSLTSKLQISMIVLKRQTRRNAVVLNGIKVFLWFNRILTFELHQRLNYAEEIRICLQLCKKKKGFNSLFQTTYEAICYDCSALDITDDY